MRTAITLTLVVVIAGLTGPVFKVYGGEVVVAEGIGSSRSQACGNARNHLGTIDINMTMRGMVKKSDSGCSCYKDEQVLDTGRRWSCEIHATYGRPN